MKIWPPAMLREHRRRAAVLDDRVSAASQEKARSQERLERVRAEVTGPLLEAGRRNRFADMIRQGLLEGHGG